MNRKFVILSGASRSPSREAQSKDLRFAHSANAFRHFQPLSRLDWGLMRGYCLTLLSSLTHVAA